MKLSKKKHPINSVLLTNFAFGFFPISFILGNFAININLALFCVLGIFHLRSNTSDLIKNITIEVDLFTVALKTLIVIVMEILIL